MMYLMFCVVSTYTIQITIFQCSKNYGIPTHITRLKVAPNMADPIIAKTQDSSLNINNTAYQQHNKSYCVLANESIDFRGQHFSKFPGRPHYLGLGRSKLKAAHQVNYFPGVWAEISRIVHPVNYSYLPPYGAQ